MPLLTAAAAVMVLGSSILVSTDVTGPGMSSYRSTPGWGGFHGLDLVVHIGHLQCTNLMFL